MSGEHFVVLGAARPRAAWFSDLGRWATSAALPVEFVRCVSVEEVRARLAAGRTWSAVVLDEAVPGLDRDLLDEARRVACAPIVVTQRTEPPPVGRPRRRRRPGRAPRPRPGAGGAAGSTPARWSGGSTDALSALDELPDDAAGPLIAVVGGRWLRHLDHRHGHRPGGRVRPGQRRTGRPDRRGPRRQPRPAPRQRRRGPRTAGAGGAAPHRPARPRAGARLPVGLPRPGLRPAPRPAPPPRLDRTAPAGAGRRHRLAAADLRHRGGRHRHRPRGRGGHRLARRGGPQRLQPSAHRGGGRRGGHRHRRRRRHPPDGADPGRPDRPRRGLLPAAAGGEPRAPRPRSAGRGRPCRRRAAGRGGPRQRHRHSPDGAHPARAGRRAARRLASPPCVLRPARGGGDGRGRTSGSPGPDHRRTHPDPTRFPSAQEAHDDHPRTPRGHDHRRRRHAVGGGREGGAGAGQGHRPRHGHAGPGGPLCAPSSTRSWTGGTTR